MLSPLPISGSFPCPLFESSAFHWLFWFPQSVFLLSGSGFLQLTSAPVQQRTQLHTQLHRAASEECQRDSQEHQQDISSSCLYLSSESSSPEDLVHWSTGSGPQLSSALFGSVRNTLVDLESSLNHKVLTTPLDSWCLLSLACPKHPSVLGCTCDIPAAPFVPKPWCLPTQISIQRVIHAAGESHDLAAPSVSIPVQIMCSPIWTGAFISGFSIPMPGTKSFIPYSSSLHWEQRIIYCIERLLGKKNPVFGHRSNANTEHGFFSP